jgi:L-ascorbate metabolism protein UlaG (beta-lactamase superfamily)
MEKARQLGLPDAAILPLDAGESLNLPNGVSVRAIPAAHEQLKTDANGHHLFLGYLWKWGEGTIYHSGDCIPYEGLSNAIRNATLALLPVNGRGKGVPGNFTFVEAVQLCRNTKIPHFIPHHFGLFAFNTLDRADLEKQAAQFASPDIQLPDVASWFTLHTK